MTEVASLGLKVDGVQNIKDAEESLAKFTTQSERSEKASDKLGKKTRSTSKQVDVLKRSTDAVTRSLAGAAKNMLALGAAAFTLSSINRTLAGFEQSMAAVSAITRASTEDLKAMREVAKQLGATTEFSASQAADGLKFLGMAGFDAAQSIAAIPDVLDLATAAQMDLARAADISSNIMSAFGISANDAAKATDVIAAVTSRANTDVEQLGEAMKTVGSVAASMGISINDTAAAIGVLSDAGNQGSSSGTGLRRILSSLVNPTSAAQKTIKSLGLTIAELNPTTTPVVEIIEKLAKVSLGASDAFTIFGDRGAPAVLALMENVENLKRLTDSLNDVEGEARRMAETMRDNLAGAFKNVASAIEGMVIGLGEAGLTAILILASDTITFVVRGLTQLINVAAAAGRAIGEYLTPAFDQIKKYGDIALVTLAGFAAPAAVGGLIALGGVVKTLSVAIGTTLVTALRAAWAVLLANPIGLVVGAIAGAIYAIYKFRDSINEALGVDVVEIAKNAANMLIGSFVAAFEDIKFVFKNLPDIVGAAAVGSVNNSIRSINFLVGTASKAIDGLIDAVNRIPYVDIPQIGDRLKVELLDNKAFDRLAESVKERNKAVSEAMSRDYIGMLNKETKALAGAEDATKKLTKATEGNTREIDEATKAKKRRRDEFEETIRAQHDLVSAIHQEAQAIEDQVLLYGRSKTAIEDLEISRLQEQISVLKSIQGSDDLVHALERQIDARLRLRNAIGALEQREAEQRAWDDWVRDMDRVFQQVGQSLTDQLFASGRSARDSIKDLFRGFVLRVAVQPVMGALQGSVMTMLGGPQQQQSSGLLGLVGQANAGFNSLFSGGSSLLASSVGSLGNAMGSQALSNFAAGMKGATLAPGLAGPTTAGSSGAMGFGNFVGENFGSIIGYGSAINSLVQGNYGSAIGTAIGTYVLPGIGTAIGSVAGSLLDGVFGDRKPTTRRGQNAAAQYIDGEYRIVSTDSRQPAGSADIVRDLVQSSVESTNELFRKAGIDAAVESLYATMESSILGDRQGVGSTGTLRVGDEWSRIGLVGGGDITSRGYGGWSEEEMLPRLVTDIQLTMLDAFKATSDQLPRLLSSVLADVDIRSLDAASAQALTDRFNAVVQEITVFLAAVESMPFEYLRDITFSAAANMIEFAGGLDNLIGLHETYFDKFFTDSEKNQHAINSISNALAEVSLTMPPITDSAEEMKNSFRALVEAQDRTTEEGQRAYITLLQVAESFAGVADFAEAAAREAEAAAREIENAARSLHDSIVQAIEDAYREAVAAGEDAYSALSRSVEKERTKIQQQADAISEALRNAISVSSSTISELTGLTSRLTSTVQKLVGQVTSDARNFEWAQERISRALSVATLTGQLPSGDDFEQALQIVAQPSQGLFDSFEDYQASFLRSAHDVSKLNEIVGVQLTAEERTLANLERQLEQNEAWRESEMARLDGILEYHRMELDIAMGTYQAVVSIPDAIAQVTHAVNGIKSASTAVSRVNNWDDQAYLEVKLADVLAGNLNPGDFTGTTTRDLEEYIRNRTGLSPLEHYERYGRFENLPGFASGINYVPYDMTANIHEGERILPKADNVALMQMVQRGANSGSESRALQNELKETKEVLKKLLEETNETMYRMLLIEQERENTTPQVEVIGPVTTIEGKRG